MSGVGRIVPVEEIGLDGKGPKGEIMARKAKPTKEWEIVYRSGRLRYHCPCQASTPERAVKRLRQQMKPPSIEILSVGQMPMGKNLKKGGAQGA
jgi:hypothetical protein